MKKLFLLSTFYFLLFTFTGCGYVSHSALPPGIKVAVPIFKNSTYHSGVETTITNEVIKKFIIEGTQISSSENADFLLTGKLTGYDKKTLRWEDGVQDKPQEYRLTLSADIIYKDLRNDKIVFSGTVSGDYDYFIKDMGNKEKESEDTAVKKAAKDLAKNIVDQICEQW